MIREGEKNFVMRQNYFVVQNITHFILNTLNFWVERKKTTKQHEDDEDDEDDEGSV